MFDLFSTIIKNAEHSIRNNASSHYEIKLSDKSDKGEYAFVIHDVPKDTLLIRADKFPNTGAYFNDENDVGICKRADYILLAREDDGKYKIAIIEITSGSCKENAFIKKQLKGATCIFKYCMSIAECYFNKSFQCKQIHYVAITNIGSPQKQRIDYTRNSALNTSVDKFLKITSGSQYHFKQLVG